jgi:aspartyl-tRNA(Asn)/glutamyl-tRNA(Gln) amidotransferase subunit A
VKHPALAELLLSFPVDRSCRAVLEDCLARIGDVNGEGSRAFTRVYASTAREQADAADVVYRNGAVAAPLAGVPVSIKDLFDVAGNATTAGSRVLVNAAPAAADAVIVSRLKQAGAVIVGRTNMTEFAYSGVGLNPHYGTPKNPYQRASALIPGGSSSGAAVSVADGMAAIAIGTDTGGSVRIPAALCGLVGFKPTARRVPMDGVLPLAPSLDSIGPIGLTVDCCARVDAVLAGEVYERMERFEVSSLRLGVLQGYVLDALDTATGEAFDRALNELSRAGAKLEPVEFSALARIPASNQTAATEAYAWHRTLLEGSSHLYDPHVSARILHGAGVLAADYLDLMRARREIIREAEQAFDGFDAILLPTTPRVAPPIASLEQSDAVYFEVNGAMLRNTSVFNFLDGCGLSVPCHREGEAPVGLLIAGLGGWDDRILRMGAAIEAALQNIF